MFVSRKQNVQSEPKEQTERIDVDDHSIGLGWSHAWSAS